MYDDPLILMKKITRYVKKLKFEKNADKRSEIMEKLQYL